MKKVLTSFLVIIICTITVFAATKNFTISSSDLSFRNSKKEAIKKEFNKKYNLNYKIESSDDKLKQEIVSLSKKVTYLLLGEMSSEEEKAEDYYNRHNEYLKMRYAPKIPKIKGTDRYDTESKEFTDDLVSGVSVPGVFLKINELDPIYNSYGDIRVTPVSDGIITTLTLPNVKMKQESLENPKEYERVSTNLVLYYYFKKLNKEYKLYYLIAETTDSLEEYMNNKSSNETGNGVDTTDNYESDLRDVYDFSKIDNLPQGNIDNIINHNKSNIMTLNSYYNNYSIGSANGIVINEGLVVTTWSFIEEALINAQYITMKDGNGNSQEIEGIVTVNTDSDLAVLKLKNKTNSKVKLADSSKLKTEDPAIIMSSKTGIGYTLRKGIIVANDGYIQNSIPVTKEEQGSPLFNGNGEVIALTSIKAINTSISLSIPSNALKEIQDIFNKIEFEKVKSITFTKLKEDYYYISYEKERVANSISENTWNEYSKIGNIDKTISLELIKASYKDKVVSLRYKNNIKDYITSMQIATAFIEELEEQGYKEVSSSTTKRIYQNSKYQVTIMEEFDYLIIVMVKL